MNYCKTDLVVLHSSWNEIIKEKKLEDHALNGDRWNWQKHDATRTKVFKVMKVLEALGAGTNRNLREHYWFNVLGNEPGTLGEDAGTKNEERALRRMFDDSLAILHTCGLVEKKLFTREEVGKGRLTAALWIAPLCEPYQLKRARDAYLNSGGSPGMASPEDQANYVDEMRRANALKKSQYRIEKKIITEKAKERKFCPKCGNDYSKKRNRCRDPFCKELKPVKLKWFPNEKKSRCKECGKEFNGQRGFCDTCKQETGLNVLLVSKGNLILEGMLG